MATIVTPQTLKVIITAFVMVILLGVTLYQARFYLLGPQIELANNNLVADGPLMDVSFIVSNVSGVFVSGKQVVPQVSGLVSLQLYLQPGRNIFLISAHDTYGTVKNEYLYITYPH